VTALSEHDLIARVDHDAAPVVAAEMLIRHGFSDALIVAHIQTQWPLKEHERQRVLEAAHIIVRRYGRALERGNALS
jgi:hypothetical protein